MFRAFGTLSIILDGSDYQAASEAWVRATVLLANVNRLLTAVALNGRGRASAITLRRLCVQIRASNDDKTRETADRSLEDLNEANMMGQVVLGVLERILAAVRAFFRLDVDSVAACSGYSIG